MANGSRPYAIGSFLLSAVSLVFILVSAATDHWVKADVRVQGSMVRPDSLHYGLYGGKVEFAQTSTRIRYNLHMVCVWPTKACAVTCKTTPAARHQEVVYLAIGYRPATLACDDDTDFNYYLSQLDQRPVISMRLYVTVNLFLYLQLLYALCSVLLSLINMFENPTHPLFGLQGVALISCACALKGLVVLLVWGINCSTSSFRNHLAFAYVAAQTSHVYISIGYSYWCLLFAVVCSLSSMALTVLRMYFTSKGKF